MDWETYIIEFARIVADNVVKSLTPKLLQRVNLNTRRRYLTELKKTILQMPLLYRGVKLTVESDYVDLRLARIDQTAKESQARYQGELLSSSLGNSNAYIRLVVFGTAGMGKTTLFRRATLEIIENSDSPSRLIREEGLTPVFVPLKAISNHQPSPILGYIFATQPYFSGESGIKRFRRLAQQGRLLLTLDGYDEIPYIGGSDFIRAELNILFANGVPTFANGLFREEFGVLYSDLQKCRVWLSSRLEFFKTFPLALARSVGMLHVHGLPNNGIALVGKLFAFYRKAFPEYVAEQLHEESFMRGLQVSGSNAIAELARSPLFLTVICHTYVHDLKEKIDPHLAWRGSANAIIYRCIRLLLSEIDEYKTEGLSPSDRRALMDRRSSWPEEKLFALKYIAGQTYRDGKALLSSEDITAYCTKCMEQAPYTPAIKEILSGLIRREPAIDMASQIRFSGVLSRVKNSENDDLYDFPHRRFRELLAVDYFANSEGAAYVAENALSESLSQLVLLYIESTSHWETVLNGIAGRLIEQASTQANHAILFAYALDRVGDREHLHQAVRRMLNDATSSRSYPLLYLDSITRALNPSDTAFRGELIAKIRAAAIGEDTETCRFLLPLLYRLSPQDGKCELLNIFNSSQITKDVKWKMCSTTLTTDSEVLNAALKALVQNSGLRSLDADCCRFLGLVWIGTGSQQRERIENLFASYFENPTGFRDEMALIRSIIVDGIKEREDQSDELSMAHRKAREVMKAESTRKQFWRMERVPEGQFNQ